MDFYEIGRRYIWHNQTGNLAYLNGTECTVTGPAEFFFDSDDHRPKYEQPTDSPIPSGRDDVYCVCAGPGDLRPIDEPPTGEQKIADLFKRPTLEPA